MMQGENLLIVFALTELVACLTPGPAVLSVMSIGLTGSPRAVLAAIAGINVGNLIWYAMTGAGLLALARTAPELCVGLRWAGIVYLFWLGLQTWRSHLTLAASGQGSPIGAGRGFAGAVAVQLSNPKALVFFTVFLPPFIDLDRPMAPQIAVLAAIGVSMEVIALGMYGFLAWRLGKIAVFQGAERVIARVSGAILMAVAVAMALSRAA